MSGSKRDCYRIGVNGGGFVKGNAWDKAQGRIPDLDEMPHLWVATDI